MLLKLCAGQIIIASNLWKFLSKPLSVHFLDILDLRFSIFKNLDFSFKNLEDFEISSIFEAKIEISKSENRLKSIQEFFLNSRSEEYGYIASQINV